ncbi:MAG TPA: hypothetical protein VK306_03885 [Acidimicrobiales bacterium]|nr:hypothetical protein [Acidimicrobiales bacterium]
MFLFTRAGRFAPGSIRDAMGFVRAVTEKVQQETGLDIQAWASTMSPEQGTTVWAAFVEDLEHLEEANDKLATSDSYIDLVEGGARLFAGPVSDGLAQVVSGQPEPSAPRPQYVTTARARAANGQLSAALANGVEIAEAATRITGAPTMFLVDATGAYGGCRWTTGFADIGALERAESALMADESWVALIDRAGPSYAADARQAIYRRIS